MKTMLRRYSAAFLALVMVLSVSVGLKLPAKAATVDYVYANNGIIKNWGVREELATFLSPNAEKFYDDENITLNELLALDGSSNTSSVPSSALYKKLQTLMANNHTTKTSYGDTRYQYQYTDCQNSGKTSNKISSFYSGKEIGPNWDNGSTWNREHTWPKSKTPYPSVQNSSVNEATDIMSLRPTASSENSSRGNDAYGPTTANNYFNPNHFANGKYDLRGDVARITLYVYVRWGNTSKMWSPNTGETGVIQSKEILLQWMEEDPVDTWELGRNDSVESITGTRNVFVDFPELAFDLFNEEVPDNYKTPSSSSTSSGYKITAISNNTAWGKVSVNKDTIIASATTGYEATGYTIVSGKATVERLGDAFTVNAASDVTIRIDFAARASKTVTFSEGGSIAGTQSTYVGGMITLPSHKGKPQSGYAFVGWTESAYSDTITCPLFFEEDSRYIVREDVTLYALYSRSESGKTYYFTNAPTGCKHTKAYKIDRVEPTCLSAGTTEGMYCPDCKAFISGHQKLSNANIAHKFDSKGVCTVCKAKKSESSSSEISKPVSSKPSGNNVSSKGEQDTTSNIVNNETSSKHSSDTDTNVTVSGNDGQSSSIADSELSSDTDASVNSGINDDKNDLVENDNSANTSSDLEETDTDGSYLWIFILVGVLLIGGGVVFVLYKKKILFK